MTLRIIAGALKGKKLDTIDGKKVRPTSGKVREAVYSIISTQISDAIVLDLFAGTGAMGIEAISRGANKSIFIDNFTNSLSTIKKNVTKCRIENQSSIIKWDILRNLSCISYDKPLFDIVFIDPPYGKNIVNQVLTNLHMSKCLKPEALIIVEHSKEENILNEYIDFKRYDQRKYGQTFVSFYNIELKKQ
ncbi:MAG: 16S rRNA (guanine(966)-N(2))-methyltransferase RsmD [Desulfobacterales bacterium]|nr:16S rRNA (guanine(966)-N(2))-methyltransferase RsmD [Desulfobacterales bacterium]